MKLTKININYDELKIREMNEIEIKGAQMYLLMLQQQDDLEIYGELVTNVEYIENETYYCGKHLHINDCIWIGGYYVGSLFVIENSYNTLFAVCSNTSEFKNDFICRIDLV